MQLLITFVIFSTICLILTYYFNLFITQTVYTRSEISNIFPQISIMLKKIYNKYSIFYLLFFYLTSGIIGVLILSFFENWLLNSALLPIILYFSIPKIAIYFEQTRVTITEDLNDVIESLYYKYYIHILTGFFSGYASKLLFNWIDLNIISFYWFLINFIIISVLMILTLRNDIFE